MLSLVDSPEDIRLPQRHSRQRGRKSTKSKPATKLSTNNEALPIAIRAPRGISKPHATGTKKRTGTTKGPKASKLSAAIVAPRVWEHTSSDSQNSWEENGQNLSQSHILSEQLDVLGRRKPLNPRTPMSWAPTDDMLLRDLKERQKLGWKEIATYFPDRTCHACQFRWRRLTSGTLKYYLGRRKPPMVTTTSSSFTNEMNGVAPVRSGITTEFEVDTASSLCELYDSPPRTGRYPPDGTFVDTRHEGGLVPVAHEDEDDDDLSQFGTPSFQEQSVNIMTKEGLQSSPNYLDTNFVPESQSSDDYCVDENWPKNYVANNDDGPDDEVEKIKYEGPYRVGVPEGAVPLYAHIPRTSRSWDQEEDALLLNYGLTFDEVNILLPYRGEDEIWARMDCLRSLQSPAIVA